MRKSIFCALVLLCAFSSDFFSQSNNSSDNKPLLSGIWQGTDRLILFENRNSNQDISIQNSTIAESSSEPEFDFSVVLRVFYGWYDDRAAESAKFSEIKTRDKNDAEARPPENISIRCRTIFENPSRNAGVYELELIYPAAVYSNGNMARTESVFVPIAVVEDKIYMDFLVNPKFENVNESDTSDGAIRLAKERRIIKNDDNSGYWSCASNADGITISPPRFKKEVTSYYIVKNENDSNSSDSIYKLRYWKSEMEYSDATATFSDGNKAFEVSKFLKIGNDLYQCTTGRSSKIRNIEKMNSIPSEILYDSDNVICALGKPYLVKVPNGTNSNDFLKIVQENNKRRKDPPKPLFPVKEIDFHWKEISELEKYNPFTWNRRNVDLGK